MLCGNIGDSASCKFANEGGSKGGVASHRMSVDHSTWTHASEYDRLSSLGMIVHPTPPPLPDLSIVRMLYTMLYGCPRVYKQDANGGVRGGLNMTRSIGDVQLKPEVSHDPDVTVTTCTLGCYVITATDGVWDEIEEAEVGGLISAAEESLRGSEGRGRIPKGELVARAAKLIV